MAALSVILPTSRHGSHLGLTLASWARQTRGDVELLIVDHSGDDASATRSPSSGQRGLDELVERCGLDRARTRLLALRGAARGAACNLAARAAAGERLLFADEGRIVARDYLAALASAGEGDAVVLGPRDGVLAAWDRPLRALGVRRLAEVMRHEPALGATLDGPCPLFGIEDVARDADALLARFRCADPLWERVAPLVEASGHLGATPLGWLVALAGGLCVPRRAALEAGLFDEQAGGWAGEDPDFTRRLWQLGLPVCVAAGARSGQQAEAALRRVPLEVIARFAARHDPVEAWLLCQLVAGRDARTLASVAAARRPGSPVDTELGARARELVEHTLRAGEGAWLW
jgi:hypothetical protein